MRALMLLAALCVVAAGCGSSDGTTAPSTAPTEATTEPAARPPAPAISGETLDGDAVSLADFRGKPVFVNVWSSW